MLSDRRWMVSGLLFMGFVLASAKADDKAPPRKADVTTTAETLAKEILPDPKAGLTKYKGKVVSVTGAVSAADPTYSPEGFTLTGGKLKPADAFTVSVSCTVPEDQKKKAWLLGFGQKVRVLGEVSSADSSQVKLINCEFKELEKNPTPTVTSKVLAAAFARDERSAITKYGDGYNRKQCFVDGTIKEIKDGQYNNKLLTLDGSGKMNVVVNLSNHQAEKLKVGDAVRLKTMCRGYFAHEKGVLLDGYYLVPK